MQRRDPIFHVSSSTQLGTWGQVFMLEHLAISWWYRLATVGLLTAGVSGWAAGFLLAIGLTAFQLIHFALRERSVAAFPVQVRRISAAACCIAPATPSDLLASNDGHMGAGLVRLLHDGQDGLLLPWNRQQALTLGLVRRTFLSAPFRGNILQGLPPK
jgi:hypothetical protein